LPGCVTYGRNLVEAKKMAKDAIKVYVASLLKHKENVPEDSSSYVANINFELPIFGRQIKYA